MDTLLAAFNAMDVDAIIATRHPDCIQHIVPLSLNKSPEDNSAYRRRLDYVLPAFANFTLVVLDVVEDRDSHRITTWLKARGDTIAGEYRNEYIWLMTFDEAGEKLVECKEFVDTVVNRDFFPELQESLRLLQQSSKKP